MQTEYTAFFDRIHMHCLGSKGNFHMLGTFEVARGKCITAQHMRSSKGKKKNGTKLEIVLMLICSELKLRKLYRKKCNLTWRCQSSRVSSSLSDFVIL